MIITNRLNLPEPLVKAVTRPEKERVPRRIGVTELFLPPQLRALKIRHENELTEDASDLIFALLGSLMHELLEKSAKGLANHIAEEKLTMEVLGWTIVGKYDLGHFVLDGETLTDWKLTSLYAFKDEVKSEWVSQVNCYVELLRRNGYAIKYAEVVAMARDWSRRKSLREKDYPKEQVKKVPIEIWDSERTMKLIEDRIRLHQEAGESGQWPECTPEERWARPDLFALMKKGQKKAVKLFEDEELATKWLASILGGSKSHFIQHRPGESIRCEGYCPVAGKCEQWKKLNPTLSNLLNQSIEIAHRKKAVA